MASKKTTKTNKSSVKKNKKNKSLEKKNKKSFMFKEYSFIDNLKESLNFIRDSKNYIYSVIAVFFFFALIGFFVPVPSSIEGQVIEFFQEIVEETEGMSALELILFILWNNLNASFFGMIFGVFFGIFPIFSSITNGYIVGVASSLSVSNQGFSSLLMLLPHGIFELPALFISLGLGVRIGFSFINFDKVSFKDNFINSLKAFLFVVVPLLIIAGIIEGFLIFLFR